MKPLRMSLVVLAVLLLQGLSAPGTARSEPGGVHVNITPFLGYGTWAKDVNLDDNLTYGARLGLGFGSRLGVEGYYKWMKTNTIYGTGDSLFAAGSRTPQTDQSIKGYGADLLLSLFPSSPVDPYLLGGWHEEAIESDVTSAKTFQNGLEFGGGIKLGLGSMAALRLEVRDKLWKFNSPPAPDPPGDKTLHDVFYSGGIQISLGGSGKDADKDGVSDSKDTCPGTPRGALVDASGCPLDADGDRVPDGIDQCPNTPSGATVDARGCPSDADGDGVPDGIDQCAGTPAGTRVDSRGCSLDSDNDGVQDDTDLCPNTQAGVKVDPDGCPITLTEWETQLLDKGTITTREIHFETAEWEILPESKPVLDDIGTILIQWPRLRIEVGGHTDSRGADAYNLDLSQKRAQSVLDYLLQKFPQIPREQYAAKGYGESKPAASNKTAAGMAKNRRVEFKVLNTEELTKERERRRLMQKGE